MKASRQPAGASSCTACRPSTTPRPRSGKQIAETYGITDGLEVTDEVFESECEHRLRAGREPACTRSRRSWSPRWETDDADRHRPGRQRAAAARRADDRREPARATCASPPRRWRRSRASTSSSIAHGNGPQVGLLALQGAAYDEVETYPLDVLGAADRGHDRLHDRAGAGQPAALRAAVRHAADDGRGRPGRPGLRATRPSSSARSTTKADADRLAAEKGWVVKPDGEQVAPRGGLARAEAHLRDAADPVAARAATPSSSPPAAAASRRRTSQAPSASWPASSA